MASDVRVQIHGLATNVNPFSAAQPGSLLVADNVVLNATNVLEPRRGFQAIGYSFGAGSDRANALAWFGSTLLVQYGTKLTRDTGAAFSDFSGTYTAVDSTIGRIRFMAASGNLYFNCNDGCRVMDTATTTPVQAGVPKGLRVAGQNAPNNGWMTPNTAVAYRTAWGIVDANGNEKMGAPTGRYVIDNYIPVPIAGMSRAANVVTVTTNNPALTQNFSIGDTLTLVTGEANFAAGLKTITAATLNTFTYAEVGANATSTLAQEFQATRSTNLFLYIPAGITTSHFFRVYRSQATATAATVPSDELYQCFEGKPTGGDIGAGFTTVNDICPEAFLGDAAPWNANDGYGLVQANERPPLAVDLAFWDSRAIYANTTSRHRMFLNLVGVGSPQGAQNNDTLTLAGTTFTFKTAAGAWPDVQLTTAYTASSNITNTAKSLVDAINGSVAAVRAYYISGEDDPPGRLLIEETGIGGAAFTAATSRATAFNPALTRSSDNNRRPHGLMFSKAGEPEAVPIVNEILVGSQNSRILRIVVLKTTLIVFKELDGIWEVTGTGGRYTTTRIGVARLMGAATVAAFADKVWALTDQGITTVTDGAGVSVVSYAVDPDITGTFGLSPTTTLQQANAVAYEADRRYLLWVGVPGGGTPSRAYSYSTATKAFTTWPVTAWCGAINPNTGKLTIGPDTNTVWTERKGLSTLDYLDPEASATLTSTSGDLLTLTFTSVASIVVGSVLRQGTNFSVVKSVDGVAKTATLETTSAPPTWTPGTVFVHPPYLCDVRWHPLTGGNPATPKLSRQLTFLFAKSHLFRATAYFNSESIAAEASVALAFAGWPPVAGAQYLSVWGEAVQHLKRVAPLPIEHSDAAQLSVGFRVNEAGAYWQLQGFTADFEADGEKPGRR